ncbi:MAG: HD domain-containing protein [Nitrososphaeria archaeon]|nr:HD domain-containing protein [Conexivisphaerales archaeon]
MIIEIMDPIYGLLKLNDLEREVIDTAEFQRLRRIKQLSSANFVYPSANHTRFEHSLGAMHLAGLMGEVLTSKGYASSEDVQKLRLAGMLHDVGHGPFSHLFEDALSKKYRTNHEEIGRRIITESAIADAIKKYGYDPAEIAQLANGILPNKAFMNAIIAGPLSADLMDYIQRDSYYTGAIYGRVNVMKIINSMHVYTNQLAIERDAVSAFEGMTIARYEMFKEVYFHKTSRAADVMLRHAIELYDSVNGFADPKDLSRYTELTDDTLISMILYSKEKEAEAARTFVKDYLSRRLLKLVYEESFIGRDAFLERLFNQEIVRERLIAQIEEMASIPHQNIFIDLPTVPSVPRSFDREDLKNILIMTKEGIREMSIKDIPVIESIQGYYNIMRIYAKKEYREVAEKVIKEIFGSGYYAKISV